MKSMADEKESKKRLQTNLIGADNHEKEWVKK